MIFSRITGSYAEDSGHASNEHTRSFVTCPSGSKTPRSSGPSAATRYPPQNMYHRNAREFGGETHAMYMRQPSLWPLSSVRGSETDGCTTYVFPNSADAKHSFGERLTATPTPKFVFASFTNHTSCQKCFETFRF